MFWFLLWSGGAALSVLSYALVSFWYDRHFVTSTWIMIWLGATVLLGPFGTLLTFRFLYGLIRDVQGELKRRGLARYPRPKKISDSRAQTHYFPLFATRRLFDDRHQRCQL